MGGMGRCGDMGGVGGYGDMGGCGHMGGCGGCGRMWGYGGGGGRGGCGDMGGDGEMWGDVGIWGDVRPWGCAPFLLPPPQVTMPRRTASPYGGWCPSPSMGADRPRCPQVSPPSRGGGAAARAGAPTEATWKPTALWGPPSPCGVPMGASSSAPSWPCSGISGGSRCAAGAACPPPTAAPHIGVGPGWGVPRGPCGCGGCGLRMGGPTAVCCWGATTAPAGG